MGSAFTSRHSVPEAATVNSDPVNVDVKSKLLLGLVTARGKLPWDEE